MAHIQNTNSQYNLPEIGKKIAYKANREGVAERFEEAAVQKTIEVDTAKQYDAHTLYLLQTVPGIGSNHPEGQKLLARLENKHDR